MTTTPRRTFLRAAAGAAAFGLLGPSRALARPEPRPEDEDSPTGARPRLRILVLGGTGFLGPHVVRAALANGHELTLFNRGKTNPGLFPDLEQLRGDRDGELEALEGREWDAVVDTSAYVPRIVRLSAGLLREKVRQYVLISTVSVYADLGTKDVDETSPTARLEDESVEKVDNETYGALKALCEAAAEAELPGRVSVVRPGLIVGPGDPTDRFTYWPVRVARGGEVLAPGSPSDTTTFIDVRDLAEWIVRVLEERTTGVFNADGPAKPLPMGRLLETCKAVSGSDATFRWGAPGFLERQGVRPWADMPAWFPAPAGEDSPIVSNARAVAAGLKFRSIEDTVRATLEWHSTRPAEYVLRAGLDAEREAKALAAWHAENDGE